MKGGEGGWESEMEMLMRFPQLRVERVRLVVGGAKGGGGLLLSQNYYLCGMWIKVPIEKR